MASVHEFYFNSSDCINKVHCYKWLPDSGAPRAVLQLAHGIAEYIARYDEFARFMADNGFAVYGNDHLGHGGTCVNSEDYCYFSDELGWFKVLEDMHRLTEHAKSEYPDIPCVLLGHSMGSFLARTYLINYPGELDGCIISGTGNQPSELCNLAILIAKAESVRLGSRGRSNLINKLCFGKNNIRIKPQRTESDWLTRENDVVDKYVADSKCGGIPTNGIVIDMFFGIKYITNRSNLRKMDPSTPVYFFAGSEDPVGDYGRGVEKAAEAFRKAGCTDVTLRIYPGGRHEMLNETNKYEVYTDVLSWLNDKIS